MITYSVIVPAYNCASTLKATIDSVFSSGLANFEIVLVDDGSNDGTPCLCDELAQSLNNVRCIHQKNAGVSAARNRGVDEAKGEYILFCDADDSIECESMRHACECIEREKPDVLMFGMSFDYYCKDRLYRRDDMLCRNERLYSKEQFAEEFVELFDCNYISPVWNKFYRKEIINNGVRFNERLFLMEDFLFTLDCLKYCETVYTLPEAVYRYKQGENDNNLRSRHARIESLSEYIKPFEASAISLNIEGSEKILNKVFFMLLRQRVRFENVDEIKKTAEDFIGSRYVDTPEGGTLAEKLKNGEFLRIYLKNRKSIIRHSIADFAKRSGLYK